MAIVVTHTPTSFADQDQTRDDELLAAYRAGDEDAASALFEKYYLRLIHLIRHQMGRRMAESESSSDLAQSALNSFFVRLRGQHIHIASSNSLWPLLVTITLNKVRNRGKYWHRQRRDPRRKVPLDDGVDPLERGPSPEDAAVLSELIDQLLSPFSQNPSRQQIIRLILEGHSVAEIASKVQRTERTVYNTRQEAAAVLRRLLDVE